MNLTLSDGTRSYDFLGGNDIYVRDEGLELPLVPVENTYAETPDSDGRFRVRSRAQNGEGSFAVYVKGTTTATFWDNVDNLLELIESAHREKGTLAYTPPNGAEVTWDLQSIAITGLPQRGTLLKANHCEAEVSFECRPYGRLAAVDIGSYLDTAKGLGPAILLPLDATNGVADTSGNSRNGTAEGGLTAGAYSPGPLTIGDDGATDFDGTNDYVSTTYTTRRNYVTDPGFEQVGANWWTAYGSGTSAADTSTTPYEGDQCGEITGGTDAGGSGRYISSGASTAAQGQIWRGFLRVKARSSADVGESVLLMVQEQNGAGALIGSTTMSTVTLTEEWQEVLVVRTLAEATAERVALIHKNTDSTALTWAVDTAMLERIDAYEFHDTGNEVQDAFAGKPDGAAVTADSGQDYLLTETTPDAGLRIVSGALTNVLATGGGAGYSQLSLTAPIKRMGGKFKFSGTSGGSVVFIALENSISGGITGGTQNAAIHFIVGPTAWAIQVIENGSVSSAIAEGSYATGLSANTEYTTEIIVDDDRVYITLPNGRMVTATDPRFAQWECPYAIFEVIQSDATSDAKGRFIELWASAEAITRDELIGPFFPTAPQLASGEAGWTGSAYASTSDIGCFANGTSRTFSGWAYRDTSSGFDNLIGGAGADGAYLTLNSGNQNVIFVPKSSGSAATWVAAWPANEAWHHWALVFDEANDTADLYIDGAFISQSAQTSQYAAAPGDFEVGGWHGAGLPYDGKQQGVAVYERALTADEIADLYGTSGAVWTLDGPIDDLPVAAIPGQVDAWGDLTLTDGSTQARHHVEIGVQENYDPASPEPLLLQAVTDLSAQAGTSTTRTGSYSTNILRASLATSAVSVCNAADQPHKGKWSVRARVYPTSTDVRVRLAWRAGNGPLTNERWVKVPNEDGWYDLFLGTVDIAEMPTGHVSEFRIEAKTTTGTPTIDVDIVTLMPADRFLRLKGSVSQETPTSAVGIADSFDSHASGALTGKTPDIATGNWSGAGDSDDILASGSGVAQRYAVSDTNWYTGRYCICGSDTATNCTVTVDIYPAYGAGSTSVRTGTILRYTDTSNWLMAYYEGRDTAAFGSGFISLYKRVAGTTTLLGVFGEFYTGWRTLTVTADSSGNVTVYDGPKGGAQSAIIQVTADASLATAGALASGKMGIYDSNTSATAYTRGFDSFSAQLGATGATLTNPAINSSRTAEVLHNRALTQNSDGTRQGKTPVVEGEYLKLLPATRNAGKSRIVVRARRDDVDSGFADSGLSDSLTASLAVTPRVHLGKP